jgi:hypothetical protein
LSYKLGYLVSGSEISKEVSDMAPLDIEVIDDTINYFKIPVKGKPAPVKVELFSKIKN